MQGEGYSTFWICLPWAFAIAVMLRMLWKLARRIRRRIE